MKIISFLILMISISQADKWKIKRNPFTVSKTYIEETKMNFLEPKNNYIPFEIKLIGIASTHGKKEAILDIEFTGIKEIGLNDVVIVNTPDIRSKLKVLSIHENKVIVSVNGGEGIVYEIL